MELKTDLLFLLVSGALARTYEHGSFGWWFWSVLVLAWFVILVLQGLVWILERRVA